MNHIQATCVSKVDGRGVILRGPPEVANQIVATAR